MQQQLRKPELLSEEVSFHLEVDCEGPKEANHEANDDT